MSMCCLASDGIGRVPYCTGRYDGCYQVDCVHALHGRLHMCVCVRACCVSVWSQRLSCSCPCHQVYAFQPGAPSSNGDVLAFVFGFESVCNNGLNNFAFARVNITSGAATLIACMDKSVSINTSPNVGSFSPDGSLFATSSGNSETGAVQVVVLDTATGSKVLDSSLPGLKKALRVSTEAPFINVWGVSWAE